MSKKYKKYYKNDDGEMAIGLFILLILSTILNFIFEYWLVVLIIVILGFFLVVIIKYRKVITSFYSNHYIKKLKKKSQLYCNIQKVNSKYNLENLNDFINYYSVKFKSELETCDIDDYLMMTIYERYDDLVKYKKKYDELKKNYQLYLEEYMNLNKYINESEALKLKVPLKKYCEYQNIIFESEKISRNYKFKVVIYINYKSKKGKVKKSIYKVYYADEFLNVKEKFNEIKNSDRLYVISSRIERNKMSDSLRYDVFTRDHNKCCICGRGKNDGVILEVDHIVPVSKGGKTVMNNLQTLCDRCNRGKSNKI